MPPFVACKGVPAAKAVHGQHRVDVTAVAAVSALLSAAPLPPVPRGLSRHLQGTRQRLCKPNPTGTGLQEPGAACSVQPVIQRKCSSYRGEDCLLLAHCWHH